MIYANLNVARRSSAEMRRVLEARGRPHVRITPAIYAVVAETQAEAEDRMALIEGLAKPIDTLELLSEVLNFDFARKGMDEAFTDEELASIGGLRAICDRVVALSGNPNPTVRDFARYSGRGTIRELPVFTGDAKRIADQMEEWFVDGAADGFVVSATHMPGAYEDFVRFVVPELQRRGLFRKEYQGDTLRQNLGLKPAEPGAWRANG